MSRSKDPHQELEQALESVRPKLEEVLSDALRELESLDQRRSELLSVISRTESALGQGPLEPIRTKRTLHEAALEVLAENGGDWMPVKELTEEINTRGLYSKRDGSALTPAQLHARTKNYPRLFEKRRGEVRPRKGS